MNSFTVLSGERIGGSCYLLETDGVRIIFDCGIKPGDPYTEHPDIPSPETVDAVFVSHAHLDHMGAIAYTVAACKNARIFMTDYTKGFVKYQMAATIAEYIGADTDALDMHNRILCELVMQRIETVSYKNINKFTARNGTECRFSLFRAGHIPGAAMTLLKIGGRRILYTGDFALFDTSLTMRSNLPKEVKADVMILCGTHSNDPDYEVSECDIMSSIEKKFNEALAKSHRLVIPVSQLTKGLELLSWITDVKSDQYGRHVLKDCRIYIEPNLWDLARYYRDRSETFMLPQDSHRLADWTPEAKSRGPVLIFERAGCDMTAYPGYKRVNADFTIHADYIDLKDIIEAVDPERLFVVHAAGKGCALEDEIFDSRLKRENITYTEKNISYNIY